MSRIGKSTGTESRLVVARDEEEEGMGRSCLMGIQGSPYGHRCRVTIEPTTVCIIQVFNSSADLLHLHGICI